MSIDSSTKNKFINLLRKHKPVEPSDKLEEKVFKGFPIPNNHLLLWYDCDFSKFRVSGIVCTDKGCFVKPALQKKQKDEEQTLYYFTWDNIDCSFILSVLSDAEKNTYQCFVAQCKKMIEKEKALQQKVAIIDKKFVNDSVVSGVSNATSNKANQPNYDFIDQYTNNLTGRHGFYAEKANSIEDNIRGNRSRVLGETVKNGPDRVIETKTGPINIQSKYCQTASDTIDAAFEQNGNYRYNGMLLEVPKDQYEACLEQFKQKIIEGKVYDANGNLITDPNEAVHYVRKGYFTYKQAVNMAKPGRIESLKFDVKTGFITSTVVSSVSALMVFAISLYQGKNLFVAIEDATKIWVKVFGTSLSTHVLLSQIHRTSFYQKYIASSAVKSNVITGVVTFAVLSIPEVFNLLLSNITFAQFSKNIIILICSITGAIVGGVGGGALGTLIIPVVGSIIGGIAGCIIGGAVFGTIARKVLNIFIEDDIERFYRLFIAYASMLVREYMLTENELIKLCKKLKKIRIRWLCAKFIKAEDQESVILKKLTRIFNRIVKRRKKIKLKIINDSNLVTN